MRPPAGIIPCKKKQQPFRLLLKKVLIIIDVLKQAVNKIHNGRQYGRYGYG
jgi:hypothetical protein